MKILILDDYTVSWTLRSPIFEDLGYEVTLLSPSKPDIAKEIDFTKYDLAILHANMTNGQNLVQELISWMSNGQIANSQRPIPAIVINNYHADINLTKITWRGVSRLLKIIDVSALSEIEEAISNFYTLEFLSQNQANDTDTNLFSTILDSIPLPARIVSKDRKVVLGRNSEWSWSKQIPEKEIEGNFDFDPGVPDEAEDDWGRYHWGISQKKMSDGNFLQIAERQKYNEIQTFDSQIENIWDLLKSFGFHTMRFYQVHPAPYANGVLSLDAVYKSKKVGSKISEELVSCSKKKIKTLQDKHGCPIWLRYNLGMLSFPLSDHFEKQLTDITVNLKKCCKNDELYFSSNEFLHNSDNLEDQKLSDFLDELLKIEETENTIFIPIYSPEYQCMDGRKGILVSIIFVDAPNSDIRSKAKDLLQRSSKKLLNELKIAAKILDNERQGRIDTSVQEAKNFLKVTIPNRSNEQAREVFLDKFLNQAMRFSNADAASIAWKSYSNESKKEIEKSSPRLESIVFCNQAYKGHPELQDMFVNVDRLRIVDERFPALQKCIETNSPVFMQTGLNTPPTEDLNQSKPRFAMPLKIAEGDIKGAIGLTVVSDIHRFLQRDIDRLMPLIEICSGVIYYLDHIHYTANREITVLHEIRRYTTNILREVKDRKTVLDPLVERRIELLKEFATKYDYGIPLPKKFSVQEIISREQFVYKSLKEGWVFENIQPTEDITIHGIEELFEDVVRAFYGNIEKHASEYSQNVEKFIVRTVLEKDESTVALTIKHNCFDTQGISWSEILEKRNNLFHLSSLLTLQGATMMVNVSKEENVSECIATINWPIDGRDK